MQSKHRFSLFLNRLSARLFSRCTNSFTNRLRRRRRRCRCFFGSFQKPSIMDNFMDLFRNSLFVAIASNSDVINDDDHPNGSIRRREKVPFLLKDEDKKMWA